MGLCDQLEMEMLDGQPEHVEFCLETHSLGWGDKAMTKCAWGHSPRKVARVGFSAGAGERPTLLRTCSACGLD